MVFCVLVGARAFVPYGGAGTGFVRVQSLTTKVVGCRFTCGVVMLLLFFIFSVCASTYRAFVARMTNLHGP